MLDYSEECLTLMDQLPRVKFHGRVSWKELADHLSTAGIWLYPTRFPEISCMCAMEAQIAGAWPIVYPTGALPETVIGGETVNSEDEAAAAIRRTIARGHDLDPARDLLSQKAKERFDIVPLAQQILDL
jgi:glycosyltransferase involved in cell wall biosynthesis